MWKWLECPVPCLPLVSSSSQLISNETLLAVFVNIISKKKIYHPQRVERFWCIDYRNNWTHDKNTYSETLLTRQQPKLDIPARSYHGGGFGRPPGDLIRRVYFQPVILSTRSCCVTYREHDIFVVSGMYNTAIAGTAV